MKIVECDKCRGFGVIEMQRDCPICGGSGMNINERGTKCPNCIGWGYIGYFYLSCENCNGKGYRDWVDEIRRPL